MPIPLLRSPLGTAFEQHPKQQHHNCSLPSHSASCAGNGSQRGSGPFEPKCWTNDAISEESDRAARQKTRLSIRTSVTLPLRKKGDGETHGLGLRRSESKTSVWGERREPAELPSKTSHTCTPLSQHRTMADPAQSSTSNRGATLSTCRLVSATSSMGSSRYSTSMFFFSRPSINGLLAAASLDVAATK